MRRRHCERLLLRIMGLIILISGIVIGVQVLIKTNGIPFFKDTFVPKETEASETTGSDDEVVVVFDVVPTVAAEQENDASAQSETVEQVAEQSDKTGMMLAGSENELELSQENEAKRIKQIYGGINVAPDVQTATMAWNQYLVKIRTTSKKRAYKALLPFTKLIFMDGTSVSSYVTELDGSEEANVAWIDFLRNCTIDSDGYLLADLGASGRKRILAGFCTTFWSYEPQAEFSQDYLKYLPFGEENLS